MKTITAITTVVLLSLALTASSEAAPNLGRLSAKPAIGATTLKIYATTQKKLVLRVETKVTGASKVVVAAAYRAPQTALNRLSFTNYIGDWSITNAWQQANQGKVQPVRVTASNRAGTTIKTFALRLPSCAKNGCGFPILPPPAPIG